MALGAGLPELPEPAALAIAAGVDALDRAQGKPLDVEGAVRGGEAAFLQERALTRSLDFELAPGQIRRRANARDVFPELARASSRDGAAASLDRVLHRSYRRLCLPAPAELRFAVVVAGRVVFNEQANARLGDELGISRGWGRMVVGGAGEASPTFEPLSVWKMVRRLGVLLRLALFAANAERRAGPQRARRSARRLGRLNHVSRRDELELGRRLVARGRRDAAADVFHVTFDELARALLEEGFDGRWRR